MVIVTSNKFLFCNYEMYLLISGSDHCLEITCSGNIALPLSYAYCLHVVAALLLLSVNVILKVFLLKE